MNAGDAEVEDVTVKIGVVAVTDVVAVIAVAGLVMVCEVVEVIADTGLVNVCEVAASCAVVAELISNVVSAFPSVSVRVPPVAILIADVSVAPAVLAPMLIVCASVVSMST